jgi:ABC-type multidrug transport system fused ATPase/permease subunit
MMIKKHFRNSFGYLVNYIRPHRGQFLLLAVLLFGGTGLQLLNPQVIRYFLDTAEAGGGQPALLLAAGLYIGFAILQRGLALGANLLSASLGWSATNALRRDLVRHVLRLDMSFHKQHTPGELIGRVDWDVYVLSNYFSRFVIQIAGNALLVAGILILLFREDLRLGLILTAYSLAAALILSRLHDRAVSRWSAVRKVDGEQYGFIEEHISGAEEISALGAGPYVLHRLHHLMRAYLEKVRAAFLMDNLMINLIRLLFAGGHAIGLALGVYLYSQGEASLGAAYLIVYYIGMISDPLVDLQNQLQDFQQATASLERIRGLLKLEPAVKDPVPALQPGRAQPGETRAGNVGRLPDGPLGVEFREVSFRYDDNNRDGDSRVLEALSFQLQPGKILGVLGRTGSGKTTLTRLLFRLYDPTGGAIFLNGTDLRHLPLDQVRSRVGLVTQEVQLFGATLRENLTLFDDTIGDEELRGALRELRLEGWLARLPDGLHTRLQAGGYGLSAGEAQLLAFTRVFLRKPGLVILDEASSRLDPATEALVEGAVDRLFQDRTGIIIAHRLPTVQRADELLILENGRLVEWGPRRELAADHTSRFYRLMQTGLEAWLGEAAESEGENVAA